MKKTQTLKEGAQNQFFQVVKKLNQKNIRFLMAGARAVAFHGYSRFTRDYDLCIAPDPKTIDEVLDVLNKLGFQFSEPVDATMISQSINAHLVSEVDIDLLIQPKGFSFEEAWKNRITVKEKNCELYFVSKNDLIVMKEASGRPQDIVDIAALKSNKL